MEERSSELPHAQLRHQPDAAVMPAGALAPPGGLMGWRGGPGRAALDDQDAAVGRGCGAKGAAGHSDAGAEVVIGRTRRGPAAGGAALEEQVGADETAGGMKQAPQQRVGDGPGRVGDDAERTPGQAEVGGIGLHDAHTAREPTAQRSGPAWMQLDRDDTCAASEERRGDRAVARADVEHEVATGYARLGDEAISPRTVESVPAPGRRMSPGHAGAPPASPSACDEHRRSFHVEASAFRA